MSTLSDHLAANHGIPGHTLLLDLAVAPLMEGQEPSISNLALSSRFVQDCRLVAVIDRSEKRSKVLKSRSLRHDDSWIPFR
jgi:hypothetical protein